MKGRDTARPIVSNISGHAQFCSPILIKSFVEVVGGYIGALETFIIPRKLDIVIMF